MLDRQAEVLVRYGIGIRAGEVVSLHGPPEAEPLLLAISRAVLRAGGQPMILMRIEECADILAHAGSAEQLAFVDPFESRAVELASATIHVLLAPERPERRPVSTAPATVGQPVRKPVAETFFRRVNERTLRWMATVFPWPEGIERHGWSVAEYQRCLARACFLDGPDPVGAWQALRQRQARLIEFLETTHELRFTTPAGTDLRIGVAGRRWHNAAGRENFPDGEVFVAPIENATEGTVQFAGPVLLDGGEVAEIRLLFRAGRVVAAAAARGEPHLLDLLDEDAGARVLGEAALGCNYALTRFMGHPLLDEKIGGTFHLALGAALPGSGGANHSGLHVDLVGDLRTGGRVEADGRVISANGRFVDPAWPQPE